MLAEGIIHPSGEWGSGMRKQVLALGYALAAIAALGCSGRSPVGQMDGVPPQFLNITGDKDLGWDVPGPPDLVVDFVADEVDQESGPDVPPVDIVPDIPPTPCAAAEDCPETGAEPCYVADCELDAMTGAGVCVAVPGPECANSDPCVDSLCTPGEGCVDVNGPDGAPCDDGDACTLEDQCGSGVCVGMSVDCDDGNFCTADMCDNATGECFFLHVPTTCDDGNSCTDGDKCFDGECTPGGTVVCDDFDACTQDSCDPATGCVFSLLQGCCNYGLQCADGNECTIDACLDHVCEHSSTTCNDNHPCTQDGCDPATGCVFTKIPGCCVVSADCNDADKCSLGTCVGGQCVYENVVECKDSNPCTQDLCDPGVGCLFLPIDDCCLQDQECDDGNACTEDWCAANLCNHKPVTCFDQNPCTEDDCLAASGCQFVWIPGCCLTTSDCDDGSLCTLDWCTNQECKHKEVDCNDGEVCTTDFCQPATGCGHNEIQGCCHSDADCQDGDPCKTAWCADTKCQSQMVACDDGDPCTEDWCEPFFGCQFAPGPDPDCCIFDLECDDGDICTTDKCASNSCKHEQVNSPECCSPDCTGNECGPDGCGGFCGYCQEPLFCDEVTFKCTDICTPDCEGKECGPDGCGTYCGLCPEGTVCSDQGDCINCIPKCAGKECGPNGCGGGCGFCNYPEKCDSAAGLCIGACDCIGASCYQDGFETGQLAGWSFDGDAEVIHNMGAAEAPQGWYMAFVGTGLSELELGKVQKTFCPPPSKKWFGFKWKHYSAEFVEWCGSIYQDTFIVTVSNGQQTIEVLALTVDELCPVASCPGCGSKFIGLEEADVVFDYEDVWMTPWSTAFFQLPDGFTTSPVTVTFEVSDVGDMVYVTAILIDAIQFL